MRDHDDATGRSPAPADGAARDLATLCAHAGAPRPVRDARPHVTPLYQTSVFDFATIDDAAPALAGDGYVYARYGLPNPDELGAAVAALEGAEAGIATSAGMAAITAAVLALGRPGDRIVIQRDAYGGSLGLMQRDLARLGFSVTPVDIHDLDAFARALDADPHAAHAPDQPGAGRAALALVESISNPLLRAADIPALATLCRARGTLLLCDNTFATPLRDRPLAHGADLVVHSATKFLGGHGDLCAGVIAGERARLEPVRGLVVRMGLWAAPMDAWLAVRGLRTLDVRMQRAWSTAATLAARLTAHPAVRAVHAADRCALVTIDLGDHGAAARFVERLQLVTLSPSLGSTTTTASHPASSSHRDVDPALRAAAGIGDGLVRLSVGLESPADLWQDLDHALAS